MIIIILAYTIKLQNGYTPLHKAVTDNDINIVKLLLEHRAKVDTISNDYVGS